MSFVILNFHGVGPVLRTIDDEERECWLDQDFFEAVLDLIAEVPQARVTFDDGNSSDIDIALPALVRRGLSATFFVCSGRLDQPTFLNRVQLSKLTEQGMSVGSHGENHVSWRTCSRERLIGELQRSREILESISRSSVNLAACPLGGYDRRVLNELKRTGYRFVYTSDGGSATDNQWIRARTTITRGMRIDDIERLIRGGPGVVKQWSIDARKLWKRLR